MGSKDQKKPAPKKPVTKKPASAPAAAAPAAPAAPAVPAAAAKPPAGHAASEPGGKLRAQVAYEGDDEFSMMSLAPVRRQKQKVELTALEPGVSTKEEYEEAPKDKGVFGLVRKFFGR
ncbi:MAG: hypothetical protein K1X89_26725 [Myxococcaceae bacterium]|nr:hypothetical protein [Myxococcaceae bacterium]